MYITLRLNMISGQYELFLYVKRPYIRLKDTECRPVCFTKMKGDEMLQELQEWLSSDEGRINRGEHPQSAMNKFAAGVYKVIPGQNCYQAMGHGARTPVIASFN
jgi:hypothetical protein